jgi:hypothetical protein
MAKNRKRVVCYQWFSMGDVLPFHLLLKSFVFSELFSQCIYNTFINKKYQTKNSTWAEKTSLYLSYSESNLWVGQWWLTPIILAIQEAEIRRIVKLREVIHETLSWKYPSQKRAGEEAQAVEREAPVQTTNDRYFTLPYLALVNTWQVFRASIFPNLLVRTDSERFSEMSKFTSHS